jgi:hypothetical protein
VGKARIELVDSEEGVVATDSNNQHYLKFTLEVGPQENMTAYVK